MPACPPLWPTIAGERQVIVVLVEGVLGCLRGALGAPGVMGGSLEVVLLGWEGKVLPLS